MADQMVQRFRVFDVVDGLHRPTDAPGRMVVGEVRLYADGTYKYGVSNVDAEDDGWGGLYPESYLTGTGGHVDVDLYKMPGPFEHRDIVVVSATHEDPDLRGQTGVVEGCSVGVGPETIAVWFADIERADVVKPEDLIATGEKVPRSSPGTLTTSQKVSTDGSLLGTEEYVLVDDLRFYL